MKKNMSATDRSIRIVLSILFMAMSGLGIVTGILGNILLIISAIFLLTSVVSFCPLYAILGLSTCRTNKA